MVTILKSIAIWFGFSGWSELAASAFKPKLLLKIWPLLLVLTPLFAFIEEYTGLSAPLFMSFFVLNFTEWYTGVKASKHEGKAMSSTKMHRFLGKTFIYFTMLIIIRQYSFHAGGTIEGSASVIFYDFLYWGLFNYITLILIRSVFENLWRMDVREAEQIYRLMDNKITRLFAYLTAPPDNEKRER